MTEHFVTFPRNLSAVFLDHFRVFRVMNHIVPFVSVFGAIVELFGAVIVMNVSVIFGDDRLL